MKQRLDTTSTETAFKPGDAVWLYALKRTNGKKQLGRPVHHKKEKSMTLSTASSCLQEASRRWSIWKGSRSTQDITHSNWFVVEDPPPRTEDSVIRNE
ncbi:hypothetical protein NQ318_003626 [Aromia moschata]|uniref:Uncharacterized protein n=1 Tax=Aromia moschata TaxID=1265417 RepID=A0AAV8XAN4_9CUCU|nr:hypothetical protein NQ318_003626 [Aromia moschata]